MSQYHASLEFDLVILSIALLFLSNLFFTISNCKKERKQLLLLSLLTLLVLLNLLVSKIWLGLVFNFAPALSMALGPALLYYVSSFTEKRQGASLIHYLPLGGMIIVQVFLNLKTPGFKVILWSLVHFSIYYVLGILRIFSFTQKNSKELPRKAKQVLFLTFLVLICVTLELFLGTPTLYVRFTWVLLLLTAMALVFNYGIRKVQRVYYAYKQINKVKPFKKYQGSILNSIESEELANRLRVIMDQEQPYLSDTINLERLAQHLNIHPKLLSQCINENFGTNFFKFINAYRIGAAQRMLLDPRLIDQKVYEIMYACGFNSRSSFISAFKEHYQLTPSQYRKKYLNP